MSSFPLTWLSCKICAIFGCVGICPGDVWGVGEGCVCLCHMLSFHYIPIQRTWLDLYDFPFNSIPFIDSNIAAKMIFRIENFQILSVVSMRLFVPLKKLSDFTLMIFCIINFQILSGVRRKRLVSPQTIPIQETFRHSRKSLLFTSSFGSVVVKVDDDDYNEVDD